MEENERRSFVGRWFLLKAAGVIAVVISLGVLGEGAYRVIRAHSGPHAFYIMSSQSSYIAGGRGGGRAYQRDAVVDGPFKTLLQCDGALKKTWHSDFVGLSYDCRELLDSDAEAMRRD